MHTQLRTLLTPLLQQLDRQLDTRLVRTFLATITAILVFRHRAYGLLLSELGAYILTPAQAPAGTKGLSNLLRAPTWSSALIRDFLWHQAERRVTELVQSTRMCWWCGTKACWKKRKVMLLKGYVRCGPVKPPGLSVSDRAILTQSVGDQFVFLASSG